MTQDTAPAGGEPAQELMVRTPIDVRSTSLAVLALLAIVGFLYLARAVFIPITISVLASYALTPIVDWLERRAKLPKPLGAGLTLALVLFGLGYGIHSLEPAAIHVLDIVPRATAKFNAAVRRNAHEPPGTVEKIRKAATEIEKAANAAAPAVTAGNATVRPSVDDSTFKWRDYVVSSTTNAIAGIGRLVVVISLVYLLLIAGDGFRRTLVRISGTTLSKRKITVQILDEINSQIQRYLLVQVATSALLGVVSWIIFAWIGLENALFWACVGGILHLIPYVGTTAFIAVVTLVAYVQFDTLQPVAVLVGSTLAIIGFIGLILVPWLTQRVGRLNAVTVFLTLLFSGWLWGVWGLLLGVPIVMALNAVCERVEDLHTFSEFLGYGPTKRKDEASLGTSAA